jgi:hypothetical protein
LAIARDESDAVITAGDTFDRSRRARCREAAVRDAHDRDGAQIVMIAGTMTRRRAWTRSLILRMVGTQHGTPPDRAGGDGLARAVAR